MKKYKPEFSERIAAGSKMQTSEFALLTFSSATIFMKLFTYGFAGLIICFLKT
jgi:hypothetical protein